MCNVWYFRCRYLEYVTFDKNRFKKTSKLGSPVESLFNHCNELRHGLAKYNTIHPSSRPRKRNQNCLVSLPQSASLFRTLHNYSRQATRSTLYCLRVVPLAVHSAVRADLRYALKRCWKRERWRSVEAEIIDLARKMLTGKLISHSSWLHSFVNAADAIIVRTISQRKVGD